MRIIIDRKAQLTLVQQIYKQIRKLIFSGMLEAGQRLPSTRRLSSELSVSRNTVIEAYSQLVAEGYLNTNKGSGTVVSEGLRALDLDFEPHYNHSRIATRHKKPPKKEIIDFRTGMPALEYFPRKEWGNLYREVCGEIPPSDFGYCVAPGLWELREQISQYLYRAKGLLCDPGQIIITSASTQGLSLTAHMLKSNQKIVLVEDPSHAGLRKVIALSGSLIKGVPVDEKGLRTDLLDKQKHVSFVFTTPSHQYPMGGILPVQRRLELIRYAEQNDCYIVEDDYDSEFRYEGQPVSSLYELNPERVIYLGSFSKILAPALRLGFMILPQKLFSLCKKTKMYADVHSDTLGQYTLAKFIQSGGFEKHIWKMKKHYEKNRKCLLNELSKHFQNQFDVFGHSTGLHLVVRFHNKVFTKETVNKIADNGIRIYRIDSFYMKEKQARNNEIILGYSHLSLDEIKRGVEVISKIALTR